MTNSANCWDIKYTHYEGDNYDDCFSVDLNLKTQDLDEIEKLFKKVKVEDIIEIIPINIIENRFTSIVDYDNILDFGRVIKHTNYLNKLNDKILYHREQIVRYEKELKK